MEGHGLVSPRPSLASFLGYRPVTPSRQHRFLSTLSPTPAPDSPGQHRQGLAPELPSLPNHRHCLPTPSTPHCGSFQGGGVGSVDLKSQSLLCPNDPHPQAAQRAMLCPSCGRACGSRSLSHVFPGFITLQRTEACPELVLNSSLRSIPYLATSVAL